MYGRDPILPIDITFKTPSILPKFTVNTYTRMLAARLTEAANIVKNSVMKQHKASKERWDIHVRPRSFSPGDRVWVFMPKLLGLPKINQTASPINKQHKRSKKLAFLWRGLCRIIVKRDESLYLIRKCNGIKQKKKNLLLI